MSFNIHFKKLRRFDCELKVKFNYCPHRLVHILIPGFLVYSDGSH